MEQKNNSVSSAETKDEVSANVEVSTSSPNNAKPNVVCSQSLKSIIIYLLSDECPVETKSLAFSHFISIVVSLVALAVSLIAFFQV